MSTTPYGYFEDFKAWTTLGTYVNYIGKTDEKKYVDIKPSSSIIWEVEIRENEVAK